MVFEAKIVKQREVAKGTHEVTFERPTSFAFKAGQYMQVAVPRLIQSDVKGGRYPKIKTTFLSLLMITQLVLLRKHRWWYLKSGMYPSLVIVANGLVDSSH